MSQSFAKYDRLLETYIETLSGIGVQGFRENPTSYLDDWCASGYLKKYWPDSANEPVFELTSGSEKAIEWLESLRTASFVGTESRLQRIFDDLENIVQFATPDMMVRLKGLRDEIAQLEAQIFKIETTGEMTVFTPAQSTSVTSWFWPRPASSWVISASLKTISRTSAK